MANKYYLIARVDKSNLSQPHSSEWPKLIAYSFDKRKLLLEEGRGHGLMGGEISLDNFNTSEWKDMFIAADSEWFLDLLSDGTIANCPDEQSLKDVLDKNCVVKVINY